MKTMEKINKLNKTNFILNVNELTEYTEQTIQMIKDISLFMNYQINGDIDNIDELNYMISDLSLNKKKKLRNYILSINKKKSLKTINKFLHFLLKVVLKSDDRVNIKISMKEQLIQSNRKNWLVQRQKSDELLLKYKESKSDFYKLKTQRNDIMLKF